MKKGMLAKSVLGMIRTNCYFFTNKETGETLIIDPADDAAAIRDWCRSEGRKPVAILLTHGHFDHILAADELRNCFGIKIYAGEGERDVLPDPTKNMSVYHDVSTGLNADVYLKDGEILSLAGFEIRVIATPGHTSGGVCYDIREEGILFSGDTLFFETYGRVDLPTSSMSDMVHSIQDKLFFLPDETEVYPGHGMSTSIRHEKQYNPLAEG